ncbi:MAG: fused MFS/spermidine synthase [Saprospiraceae bacterium]
MTINPRYIYFLSFLEGAAVMACELAGAKILAPYFGTSLYVWAAALGLTLGGLMSGYFLGGRLSKKYAEDPNPLFLILIAAGFTMFIMPFTSTWVMEYCLDLTLQIGATLSLLVFMFPPLVFMGMVSPFIINLLTSQANEAGNRAGNVYAISTLGGILSTFLMGFWIIPAFGIKIPSMVWGLLLASFPAVSLFRTSRFRGAQGLLLLMVCLFFASVFYAKNTNHNSAIKRHEEGILGQLKVMDFKMDESQSGPTYRGLIVNNTLQTVLNLDNPEQDYWPYTRLIPSITQQFEKKNGQVLLLGMGGGTLAQKLHQQGFEVDAVEIDARLQEIAQTYFNLSDEIHVFIDDARHFVRTSKKQYDLIVFDVFRGESAPEHILTLESIREAQNILASDGLLLVNFYGYWEGEKGVISQAVFNTLSKAGFHTSIFQSAQNEDERNLVFCATNTQRDDLYPAPEFDELIVKYKDINQDIILTDENPQLFLYGKAAAQWRRLYNKYYTRRFSDPGH